MSDDYYWLVDEDYNPKTEVYHTELDCQYLKDPTRLTLRDYKPDELRMCKRCQA